LEFCDFERTRKYFQEAMKDPNYIFKEESKVHLQSIERILQKREEMKIKRQEW